MWKPRPEKWLLWAFPMVALPTFAAFWLNTSTLIQNISARSTEQLFAIGANWAVPTFNVRDVTLGGDAPSQQAIDTAMDALAGVYGVRTVISNARVVAPLPVTLVAPRIKALTSNSATPEITGTWQEGAAKTFSVTLAGKVYKFGTDAELSSDAGAWTLKPSVALADGTCDATAEVSDGINPAIGTTKPTKLVIDTVAPPAPAITPVASGIQWPFTLNGTWVEDGQTSLTAKLANQTWILGKDDDLKSDGKGNWSFAPVVDLRPGTYDVTLEASDRAGNISKSVLAAAIVIQEQPASPAIPIPTPISVPIEAIVAAPTLPSSTIINIKAPVVQDLQQPAPAQQPEPVAALQLAAVEQPASVQQTAAAQSTPPTYDCASVLAEISTTFPIRFAFNDTQLKSLLDIAMTQYAALLKDHRCATMKVEIAGHADFFGPRLYNQALSEARARTVVSALVAAGVDGQKLSIKGFNESMPADTEKTIAARQKNRRVEITLVK
jgi:outer membrane protein OmpA-like peptidoglycan-associated protein